MRVFSFRTVKPSVIAIEFGGMSSIFVRSMPVKPMR
jgi:hypothetical protein